MFLSKSVSHFLLVQSSQARTIQGHSKLILLWLGKLRYWFQTNLPFVDQCESLRNQFCEMALVLRYLCKLPNKGDVVLELILEPSSKIKEERERKCLQAKCPWVFFTANSLKRRRKAHSQEDIFIIRRNHRWLDLEITMDNAWTRCDDQAPREI